MRAIAVIPARGGSKRIPRKNIVDFFGRSLIGWTIQAAIESKEFARVVVSTEDPEIAEVAVAEGAECPFLRYEHYDDFSSASEATISTVRQAQDHFGETYEIAAQLMATCPLRSATQISDSFEAYRKKGRTFQISCFEYGWMNPWWAMRLSKDGVGVRLYPDGQGKRSQDLERLYCPTGALWIARTSALLAQGTFYGEPLRYEPIDWTSAVDIDTLDDLQMAKALYLLRRQSNPNGSRAETDFGGDS